MVVTASEMLSLGTIAPDFRLYDTRCNMVSLADFKDAPALLVIFMCNHCPFVKYILKDMVALVRQYQDKAVAVAAINSNDIISYPEDSPQMMAELAEQMHFTFPYLYDETQQVAKAYHAACTPDFFLFDRERKLVYRGQMDDSRPSADIPITGCDLTAAIDAVLEGKEITQQQKPSMGCNIKWKPGNELDYIK